MTTPEPDSVPDGARTEADRAAEFEESPQLKIRRLERTLADERRHSVKATRQLHRALLADLREAEQRAAAAEKRAGRAERQLSAARRRAGQAEAEVERMRASRTWRAGRAVASAAGVPGRIKRWGR